MSFSLPDLPYPYDALAPFMSRDLALAVAPEIDPGPLDDRPRYGRVAGRRPALEARGELDRERRRRQVLHAPLRHLRAGQPHRRRTAGAHLQRRRPGRARDKDPSQPGFQEKPRLSLDHRQIELAGSVVGGGSEVNEVFESPSQSFC